MTGLGTDASIRPTLKTNCTTNDKNYQNNPTLADHQIPVGFCEAKEVKFNNYWSGVVGGLQRTIQRKNHEAENSLEQQTKSTSWLSPGVISVVIAVVIS